MTGIMVTTVLGVLLNITSGNVSRDQGVALAKMSSSWSDYLRRSEYLQGDGVEKSEERYTGTEGVAHHNERRFAIRARPGAYLYRHTHKSVDTGKLSGHIFGINDKYWFHLITKEEGLWALESVGFLPAPEAFIKEIAISKTNLNMLVACKGVPLPAIFAAPTTKGGIADRNTNGDNVVLNFSFLMPHPLRDNISYPVTATATLDSNNMNVIMEIDTTITMPRDEGRYKHKYEYYIDKHGLPIPKKGYLSGGSSGGTLSSVLEYDLHVPDDGNWPALREFTLGYYGFMEPDGVEWPRPTPWWLYLAGGTVFFFVLALLLGVAIRRLNARAAG